MKRKKRVEAWVVAYPDGEIVAYESKAQALDEMTLGPDDRLVRLVEYDAAKEAVVRATVEWAKNPPTVKNEDDRALLRAVEKYQKGKR